MDELCSESSDSSSTSDATTVRWFETFETRVASSQPTPGRAVSACGPKCSGHSATDTQPKGPRPSGVDPTHEGGTHRCPRSECSSVNRHCCAWHSRDAPYARGRLVGRKHERVCRRITLSQATKVPTAISIPTSTSVSPASLVFLGRGGWCKCACKPSTGNVTRMH